MKLSNILYGVFVKTKFGLTYDRTVAIKHAEALDGTVRAMPDPTSDSWDAPTFHVCSKQIYPTVEEDITKNWPRAIC